eukprot:gene6374-12550_t
MQLVVDDDEVQVVDTTTPEVQRVVTPPAGGVAPHHAAAPTAAAVRRQLFAPPTRDRWREQLTPHRRGGRGGGVMGSDTSGRWRDDTLNFRCGGVDHLHLIIIYDELHIS